MSSKQIEEGSVAMLDFQKIDRMAEAGFSVIPVVVQSDLDNSIIMIGYANQLALDESFKTGYAVFWSTSRNELWHKGKSSGDRLKIKEIRVNCEQNSLLYVVIPEGRGACHTKGVDGNSRKSCFYRTLDSKGILTHESRF